MGDDDGIHRATNGSQLGNEAVALTSVDDGSSGTAVALIIVMLCVVAAGGVVFWNKNSSSGGTRQVNPRGVEVVTATSTHGLTNDMSAFPSSTYSGPGHGHGQASSPKAG